MSRTVTSPTKGKNRGDMNAVGYIIAAGVLLVLIPVLPLIIVLEIVERLTSGSGDEDGDRRPTMDVGR